MHWPQSVEYYGDHRRLSCLDRTLTRKLDANDRPFSDDGGRNMLPYLTFKDTWAQMEEIYASGKAKAIGVSNFSIKT